MIDKGHLNQANIQRHLYGDHWQKCEVREEKVVRIVRQRQEDFKYWGQ